LKTLFLTKSENLNMFLGRHSGPCFVAAHCESTEVLSVFGVTERPVRSRMPKTIYLYHPERMTDGGVGPPIPSGTDDGWGVLARPYPSVERKKTDFWKTIQGRGGPK